MDFTWLEWLGYLASLIVLISLLMSSIIKLRWINLLGSSLFSLYGFLIGALPVGLMNLGIAIINIYYLVKIYSASAKNEYFKLLSIERDSEYFHHFLNFYKEGLKKYTDPSKLKANTYEVSFYILRNMVPAGVFLGSKYDDNTLKVELDFVIPEYRDFKTGHFIYEESKDYFLDKGFDRLISYSSNDGHIDYLRKMGFEEKEENGSKYFEKFITN
ncbi:YgjV family protein [Anaerobacillus isosaccharinicus]|uniref:YgjV family protein n=1 Tax=Anaerobacillus isosaccharinicus TaxID=1532552 RepID=A0A1S2M4R7_9BACI|nr:YgjV family protein [Anaerobacillus isosaccharinicus]MBA5586388.1 YgjV family protein [Anaerobacillus isosaccharinicus]QOY35366.1 YgjV family protein [Anaerobacillus isosaccharinicus]